MSKTHDHPHETAASHPHGSEGHQHEEGDEHAGHTRGYRQIETVSLVLSGFLVAVAVLADWKN
ncbi:MAG: hypothetical protein ACREH8_07645, partial [Opitutaceae bacterium]